MHEQSKAAGGMIVYLVTCVATQVRKQYVGITSKSLGARWSQHKSDARSGRTINRPLHKALRKYGFDGELCI